MPTGNPLEQLRRRMQSHATPAAFAALAEEHRRAGRLDEAIAVCRDGLAQYPAYVSARVTLGRALLDSGDVAGALEELEQAVAQAPDNFAAVRALEAAHAAAGAAPPQDPPPDLALHAPSVDDTADIPGDLLARVLGTGADGPQEFGLGPDWSLPEPHPLPSAPEVTPDLVSPDEVDTAAAFAHADAPTMVFTPPHLQGEEPAGIWPVPAPPVAADPVTDAAPVYSWALDPPAGGEAPAATPIEAAVPAPPSIWDAPTIDAPLSTLVEAPADAPAFPEPVSLEAAPLALASPEPASPEAATPEDAAPEDAAPESPWTTTEVEGTEAVAAVDAAGSDDQASSFWSDFADAGTGASDPVPFAGWGDVAAPEAEAAPAPSPWEDDNNATGAWAAQDGPSAAWSLPGPDELPATPFQDVLGQEVDRPVPASFAEGEATGVDPVPFTDGPALAVGGATPWQGSLASALEEVFARAGGGAPSLGTPTSEHAVAGDAATDAAAAVMTAAGGSLEPPTSEVTAVRMAMADVAVEAAIEDAAQPDSPPALASLEQLLASVRARRASLFSSLPS